MLRVVGLRRKVTLCISVPAAPNFTATEVTPVNATTNNVVVVNASSNSVTVIEGAIDMYKLTHVNGVDVGSATVTVDVNPQVKQRP